ncbi:hypothetical protein [Thalassococcus lentus]|uniref:Uncharacterized protein n=1 Tax=Thalassococcus lentus TaxID=1210524 RepID=A0ABT4XQJ3_9RHOB|nr:hypothetical protein [Thalassococcus lentus]MDA7424222.1 hypothetical protein [Thalassococcus lentus]
MKRVCDYFNVDARILLEPLDAFPNSKVTKLHNLLDSVTANGLEYVFDQRRFFEPKGTIETGMYFCWRRSFSDNTKYIRVPMSIRVFEGALVTKGYDPRQLVNLGYLPEQKPKEREFHGMVMEEDLGVSFFIMHSDPIRIGCVMMLEKVSQASVGYFSGIALLLRKRIQNLPRISSVVFHKASEEDANPIRLAHSKVLFDADEIPTYVLRELQKPIAD